MPANFFRSQEKNVLHILHLRVPSGQIHSHFYFWKSRRIY
jgi:hypothetical protein